MWHKIITRTPIWFSLPTSKPKKLVNTFTFNRIGATGALTYTHVKMNNLFSVDINRLEQGSACILRTSCQQCCYSVVQLRQCCNNNIDNLFLRPFHTCNFCCDFRCDFLLLMDVNEWMSYECSDEGTCTQNIHYSSTRSHASEEDRT